MRSTEARPRLFGDHRKRLRGKFADDRRAARFDDAGLVPGDIGDGRSECDEVIQTDAGDDADDGVDDVGGVEPPARPHLHHGDVDLTFGEPPVSKDAPHFGIADWQLRLLGRKEAGR